MERITTAAQAKKYIGQKLQWRPRTSFIWRESVLHEVVRKNVRLGGDWRWLPDILLITPTPLARTMEVCPDCGNKRCPRATDPALPCTGSRYTTPTPGAPTDAQ